MKLSMIVLIVLLALVATFGLQNPASSPCGSCI